MTTITKFKIEGAWTTTEKAPHCASIDAVIANLNTLNLGIDRERSDKQIKVNSGGLIREATLPLDHPEMKETRTKGYVLRDSYSGSLLIKLENVPGVDDAGVSIKVKYRGIEPEKTVSRIADTIRKTYLGTK